MFHIMCMYLVVELPSKINILKQKYPLAFLWYTELRSQYISVIKTIKLFNVGHTTMPSGPTLLLNKA